MSVRLEVLGLVIACSLVTFIPRVVPFWLVRRIKLPPLLLAWLAYIPAAVISALFFNEVLLDGNAWRAWDSPHMVAGVAVLLVAFASRSIYLTVIAGMAVFALMRWLAG